MDALWIAYFHCFCIISTFVIINTCWMSRLLPKKQADINYNKHSSNASCWAGMLTQAPCPCLKHLTSAWDSGHYLVCSCLTHLVSALCITLYDPACSDPALFWSTCVWLSLPRLWFCLTLPMFSDSLACSDLLPLHQSLLSYWHL